MENGQNQGQQGSENQQGQAGKLASYSRPVLASTVIPKKEDEEGDGNNGAGDDGAGAGDNNEGNSSTDNNGAASGDAASPISEDQVKQFLESKGIKFAEGESFESLKAKLEGNSSTEPTAEEKKKQEAAMEKRMLDLYLSQGGQIEHFTAFKQILNSEDLHELTLAEIRKELKENNFNDDEIDLVLKERYYQFTDEEIEEYEEETAKDLLKKKKEFGTKKLASRSLPIKQQAESIWNGLKKAVEDHDLQEQEEVAYSSKVEDHFSKLPRKLTFQLGKVNDHEVAPIVFDVEESDIAEVKALLADASKRQTFFHNEDETLNYDNLANVLVRNKILESALKKVYLESATRQTEIFKQRFPARTPHDVGVGSAANRGGTKGKLVGRGKATPVTSPSK